MPEPTSSGVAGAVAFKAAGGAAAGGALLSTIVVMLMTPPRSTREWAVGLISTVVTGIGGGATAVQYFRLQEWVDSVTGLVALGGLIFGCGLPGWAIVRWVFKFLVEKPGCGDRRGCRGSKGGGVMPSVKAKEKGKASTLRWCHGARLR